MNRSTLTEHHSIMLLTAFVMLYGCNADATRFRSDAEYVGRERCISCHTDQDELFTGSDHDLAMAYATEETVLGDFENAAFTYFGTSSRFFRRDGKFFVFTEGPGGTMDEYEVKYTFGVQPLQQYLVEFPGGRLQYLPLAWDTRPRAEGGQRWFHLYSEQRILPNDLLYWTQVTQNWNTMCAECHSTNLQKNYDSQTNRYNTTWSEINVSCEACHGPGSRHVDWAEASRDYDTESTAIQQGLVFDLENSKARSWIMNPETGIAALAPTNNTTTQVDMCGRCHSHRMVISENYVHGKPLSDTHQVSLLDENLYFPDGQIKEEVYVYGSFLQSKMYQAGVICTDCHDPHSTKLVLSGDKLCFRCHLRQKYGTMHHHFHEADAAVECIDCHMPKRTYMVVDVRRDHSFRVPRPDLSAKLATPNTCNQCHDNKSGEWASSYFKKWYPGRSAERHFGEIFFAARKSDPKAVHELRNLIADQNYPAIIRATAISLLHNYPGQVSFETLKKALSEPESIIRKAAVDALPNSTFAERHALLESMLGDPARIVRLSAARLLATDASAQRTVHESELFEHALNEYKSAQKLNADYPTAHLSLANFHLERREYRKAESELLQAIEIEPLFVPSYVNLADLYRVQNLDKKGKEILLQALEFAPDDASLHHALGLLYIRTGENENALQHLAQAAGNAPGNARYNYVYAIALHTAGKQAQAIAILEQTLSTNPFDRDLLQALVSFHQKTGNFYKARTYAEKLTSLMDLAK